MDNYTHEFTEEIVDIKINSLMLLFVEIAKAISKKSCDKLSLSVYDICNQLIQWEPYFRLMGQIGRVNRVNRIYGSEEEFNKLIDAMSVCVSYEMKNFFNKSRELFQVICELYHYDNLLYIIPYAFCPRNCKKLIFKNYLYE